MATAKYCVITCNGGKYGKTVCNKYLLNYVDSFSRTGFKNNKIYTSFVGFCQAVSKGVFRIFFSNKGKIF